VKHSTMACSLMAFVLVAAWPGSSAAECLDDVDANCAASGIANCHFDTMGTDVDWQHDGVCTGDWYGHQTNSSWRNALDTDTGHWQDAWVEQAITIPSDAAYLCVNTCRDCWVGNDESSSRLSVLIAGSLVADHVVPPPETGSVQIAIPPEYLGQSATLRIQIEGDANGYAGLYVNWVGFDNLVPVDCMTWSMLKSLYR
jgi:hypothetical protein